MRQFHVDGIVPCAGEIWVFGSNLAGWHGAGAAKVAYEKFQARWGVGAGPTGNAYAIPTKMTAERFGGKSLVTGQELVTMPISGIKVYADAFIDYADALKYKTFFITRIGCGLAGYKDEDIGPLFYDAPDSCIFPAQWRDYV